MRPQSLASANGRMGLKQSALRSALLSTSETKTAPSSLTEFSGCGCLIFRLVDLGVG